MTFKLPSIDKSTKNLNSNSNLKLKPKRKNLSLASINSLIENPNLSQINTAINSVIHLKKVSSDFSIENSSFSTKNNLSLNRLNKKKIKKKIYF